MADKGKERADLPRITFHAKERTFDRLFNEKSLEQTKDVVRKKLGLSTSAIIKLAQLRAGKTIDLEDDDDFDAFCSVAYSSNTVEVQVTVETLVEPTTNGFGKRKVAFVSDEPQQPNEDTLKPPEKKHKRNTSKETPVPNDAPPAVAPVKPVSKPPAPIKPHAADKFESAKTIPAENPASKRAPARARKASVSQPANPPLPLPPPPVQEKKSKKRTRISPETIPDDSDVDDATAEKSSKPATKRAKKNEAEEGENPVKLVKKKKRKDGDDSATPRDVPVETNRAPPVPSAEAPAQGKGTQKETETETAKKKKKGAEKEKNKAADDTSGGQPSKETTKIVETELTTPEAPERKRRKKRKSNVVGEVGDPDDSTVSLHKPTEFDMNEALKAVLANRKKVFTEVTHTKNSPEVARAKNLPEVSRSSARNPAVTSPSSDVQKKVNASSVSSADDAVANVEADEIDVVAGSRERDLKKKNQKPQQAEESESSSSEDETPLLKRPAAHVSMFEEDEELMALVRGPQKRRKSIMEVIDRIEAEGEEEDEKTEDVVLEEDEEIKIPRAARRSSSFRRMASLAATSDSEEMDDDEDKTSENSSSLKRQKVFVPVVKSSVVPESPTDHPTEDPPENSHKDDDSAKTVVMDPQPNETEESLPAPIVLVSESPLLPLHTSTPRLFTPEAVDSRPPQLRRVTRSPIVDRTPRAQLMAMLTKGTTDPIEPAETFERPVTPEADPIASPTFSTPRGGVLRRMKDKAGKVPSPSPEETLVVPATPPIPVTRGKKSQKLRQTSQPPAEEEEPSLARRTRSATRSQPSMTLSPALPIQRRRQSTKLTSKLSSEQPPSQAALREEEEEESGEDIVEVPKPKSKPKPKAKAAPRRSSARLIEPPPASTARIIELPRSSQPPKDIAAEIAPAEDATVQSPPAAWTTLNDPSSYGNDSIGLLDELGSSSPSHRDENSQRKGPSQTETSLFLESESQGVFPYSQWQSLPPDVDNESNSSDDEEEVAAAISSTPAPSAVSMSSYPKLSDIASQHGFFSSQSNALLRPTELTKQKPTVNDFYEVDEEDSGPDSSSDSEAEPSHIPKSRIAGMKKK